MVSAPASVNHGGGSLSASLGTVATVTPLAVLLQPVPQPTPRRSSLCALILSRVAPWQSEEMSMNALESTQIQPSSLS
jgi:hypothetical protein